MALPKHSKFISLLTQSFYLINPTQLHFQLFYYFLVWFLTSFLSHAGPALSSFLTFPFLPDSRSNSLVLLPHPHLLPKIITIPRIIITYSFLFSLSFFLFCTKKGGFVERRRELFLRCSALNERSHVQIPGRVVIWKNANLLTELVDCMVSIYMKKRKLDNDL